MATLVANADLDHIAGEQFEVMLVSTFIWLQVELVRITCDLQPYQGCHGVMESCEHYNTLAQFISCAKISKYRISSIKTRTIIRTLL